MAVAKLAGKTKIVATRCSSFDAAPRPSIVLQISNFLDGLTYRRAPFEGAQETLANAVSISTSGHRFYIVGEGETFVFQLIS